MVSSRFAPVGALFAGLAFTAPAFAQGQVTVYCSILEEQCREGAAMFEKATGIKVSMVRKSTGEVYAQVKAEANNPRGDVWWGGPGEPHLQAAAEGLLEEYKSPRLPELHDWAQRHAEQSGFRTNANANVNAAQTPVDQAANPSNDGSTLNQKLNSDQPSTARGQNKKAEDDTPTPQVVAPNITMNIDNTQTTASVLRMRRDEDGSLIVEKVAQ